jgi:competence protein ComEA
MQLRALGAPAVLIIASAIVQPPPDDKASPFAAGPGRDALIKVCGNCHGPESAVAQFKTHEEWVKTLDEMANNGAQGSDEEWNQIQAYLDKNYTLIFVNKAAARDLESMLDIPAEVADAIVKWREQKGNFKSIDELKALPGLAAATIDARRGRLIF